MCKFMEKWGTKLIKLFNHSIVLVIICFFIFFSSSHHLHFVLLLAACSKTTWLKTLAKILVKDFSDHIATSLFWETPLWWGYLMLPFNMYKTVWIMYLFIYFGVYVWWFRGGGSLHLDFWANMLFFYWEKRNFIAFTNFFPGFGRF